MVCKGPPLPAIGSYGLIGDGRSAALCSPSGSLDWWCVPRFDADPVFGRLVGSAATGCFRMGPADADAPIARRGYRTDSPVLETSWHAGSAELTLTEALVAQVRGSLLPHALLVRRLSARGGPVEVEVMFDPRHGPPRVAPRADYRAWALVCTWGADAIAVTSSDPRATAPGRRSTPTLAPDSPFDGRRVGGAPQPAGHRLTRTRLAGTAGHRYVVGLRIWSPAGEASFDRGSERV